MPAYKDTERGTWYVKLYYNDWRGQKKQHLKRGFTKKKDALAYERNFKDRESQQPSMTLSALSEVFLTEYKVRRRPATYRAAESVIRCHVLPHLGDLPVNKITPLTIRKWQNTMMKKDFSQCTLSQINAVCKMLFNYAVKYYNLPASPFAKVDPMGKVTIREGFLDLDQWKQLSSKFTTLLDRATYNLFYWGGLRLGELQGLTVDDFDFDGNTVSIQKQYSGPEKKLVPLKTASSARIIALPDFVMDMVKAYFDSYYEVPELPFAVRARGTICFRLREYCKIANVPVISTHSLRHSHASLLIHQGVPVNQVAERLGHSSGTVTLRVYAHTYTSANAQIATMLNDLGK